MSTITPIQGSDNITGSNDTINTNFDNLNTDKLESSDIADFETSTQLDARDVANRARANHTGTQSADTIVDGTTNKVYTATEKTKLAGIEDNAEVNNISDSNATDLTDAGNTTLHYHATDRDRANHTGTQAGSTVTSDPTTISDGATVDLQVTDIAESVSEQLDSGFVSWTGTGDYWSKDIVLGTFTLLRGGKGRMDGKEINWLGDVAGSQTVSLNLGETVFLYIDANGDLQKSTTFVADQIMLFEAWRCATGDNIIPVKENHPYNFDSQVSATWHKVFGVAFTKETINTFSGGRVTTGTGALATDRQIKHIGTGEFSDHGLSSIIPDSAGLGVFYNFPYINASGKWECAGRQQEILMQYNNGGTNTSIGLNKYGVFKFYTSKDDLNDTTPQFWGLMSNADYSNQAAAQTAITNDLNGDTSDINSISGELKTLELARLGYCIVQNNASGGYIVTVQTELETAGGGNASVAGGDASSTSTDVANFDNNLSASDTNVQAALDTLDNITIGDIETASNVGVGEGEVFKGKTGQDLAFKTILAGTGVTITNGTDEIQIDATGAGGGEVNTASNVGLEGVGVFKQKTGVNLEFKKINPSSDKVSITDDVTNSDIDIDIVESNIDIANLGGTLDHVNLANKGTNTHAEIDTHIADTSNPHSVTATQVGLGNVDNTSDADKPVSTATQTALDLKSDKSNTVTSTAGTPVGADRVIEVVSLTSAEYAAATKVATTLYIITDA